MMNVNSQSENCDKINNRTHHTRFFEKLYGNLEKRDEKKDEICEENLSNNLDFDQRRVTSPSESSVSSNEIFNLESNLQKSSVIFPSNQHQELYGLSNTNLQSSSAIFSNNFGSLRIPTFGFPPDTHNHFAAFCKLRLR